MTWLCGITSPAASTTRALIATTEPLDRGVVTSFESFTA
ncbi:MAG: hypothetical protein QOG41_1319 [Thermoleophilaceae bacterium]|nr:hypothetical protein [Thermoleophilaceae bacterium]